MTSMPSSDAAPLGVSKLLLATLAGCTSAALLATALMNAGGLLFLLIYSVVLPLGMVALSLGGQAGIWAAVCGSLAVFLVEPANVGVIYTVLCSAPAAGLAYLATQSRKGDDGKTYWYPESFLLMLLAVYPAVLFVILNLFTMGSEQSLLEFTRKVLETSLDTMKNDLSPEVQAQIPAFAEKMAHTIPGLLGVAWFGVMLFSLAMTNYSLVRKGWALRPNFALQAADVPNWFVYVTAAVTLGIFFLPGQWPYMAVNVAIIFVVPFVLVGLAVVHAWASTRQRKTTLLAMFYVLLSIIPWLGLCVALLGVIDQWANFRDRFAATNKN